MFKRRDIPPVLLLLLLIVLVMLTLSQILVVHNGRYGGRSVHNMRKLQLELREMDINLHSLMLQNVPSIELNRRLLQNQINAGRIAAIIRQAAEPQLTTKRTASTDEGRVPPQQYEQENYQSQQPHGTDHLTLFTGLVTRAMEPLRSQEAELLDTRTNGDKSAQAIGQQSQRVTERSSSRKSNGNGTLNEAVPNATQAVVPSANQLDGGNPSSVYYSQRRHPDSSNNTNSSSTPDSIHKQNHLNNVANTFHPDPGGSLDDIDHRTKPSVTSAANAKHSEHNSLTHDHHSRTALSAAAGTLQNHKQQHNQNRPSLSVATKTASDLTSEKESPPSQKSQQMSQSRKVPADTTQRALSYCPSIPPGLQGNLHVKLQRENYTASDIISTNPELLPGGSWRPKECMARHKVAVIIPYRDREEHLTLLLYHLHPMLRKQQLDYTVIVVEQFGKDTFNKARIMNIAFVEALKLYGFQCFVFHDVDLIPEDDRNMYSCPPQPRHMSVAIDNMGYKLAYQELVGGVLNMRSEHFQRVNGYSNLYWGWGAEDDDMAYRIMHVGLKITRPVEAVARYKMAKHTKRKPADWRKRAKLLYTGTRRFQFDGLNSLQYKVVSITKRPLYTHMTVDIGKPPRGF